MLKKSVQIVNTSGLHLRPAGNLCKEAIKYKCKISLIYKGGSANAKSVLAVLAACVKFGDYVDIICDGEDEKEAMDAIIKLVDNGCNENE